MAPIKLFVGFDKREAVGLSVFIQSVLEHASVPVSITPLSATLLPRAMRINDGSNHFTWARFAVPRLCDYKGGAIFMDGSDMLMKADIAELEAQRSGLYAVQCVQHDYKTKYPFKYVGTPMESPNIDYPRKNWASCMLINASHYAWKDAGTDRDSLQLKFIPDRYIGALPPEWNHLADEYGESKDAKVLHWTTGIPAFPAHSNGAHAQEWFDARDRAMAATG